MIEWIKVLGDDHQRQSAGALSREKTSVSNLKDKDNDKVCGKKND